MDSPPSGSPSNAQAGHYAFPASTRSRIAIALSPHVLVPTRKLLAPAAFAPPQRCAQLAHLADATHERALVDAYAKRTATLADEEKAHQERVNRVRAAALTAIESEKADTAKKEKEQSSSSSKASASASSAAAAPGNPINYAEFEAPQAPLDPWDAAEAANNGTDSGKQDWQALQRVMMGHSAPVNRLGAGSQLVSTSSGPKSPIVPPRPDPNRVAAVLNQAAPVSTHASGGGKPAPSSLPGAFPTVTPPQSYGTIPGAGSTPPPPNTMPMPLPMPSVHNPHPHPHGHPPAYQQHQPPPMQMPMPLPGVASGNPTTLGFGPHSMPRPGSNPNVNVMPGATPPLPPRNPMFVPPPVGTTPPPAQGMIGSPGQNRRPNKAPPPVPAGTQQGAGSPAAAASARPSPRDLPAQFHPMFYSLLDMGFTPDSITLALHMFRDNQKRVTDFCLLYPSLPTPLPPRAAITTAVHTLYNAYHPSEPDADTLRKHIVAFARIVDMGFAPDAAATALVVAKGNEQEAVETLMGS
ncbi:hypothetical protein BCR44DRAFT_35852 [Catenaria anguillulae PL171]|uniref:UBA domain-containing protein n=1 Tax=Catenaria anguillulae PL171 TaxID=765915 RepID=A0A1Y2HSG6_9FUNG|nr:hypothetical protein BCR44DRAFT_35852 [Catenaria anguillulae PL171]